MIDKKLKKLSVLLDQIEELSSSPGSREDKLRLARKFENIVKYRIIDIECNLLEEVTRKDMSRINDKNAAQILNEYPAGFYRTELRTHNNKKETNNE